MAELAEAGAEAGQINNRQYPVVDEVMRSKLT